MYKNIYNLSLVIIHEAVVYKKKGGSDISLPKMDIPIDLLQWEVFLPERYKVKDFGGDAIAANLLPPASQDVSGAEEFQTLELFGRASSTSVGAATEVVAVEASNGPHDTRDSGRLERNARKMAAQQQTMASANVTNLQQRVSGVLPVRIDVPRAGNSYHFVRPLVLDEETKVSFTYKTK